LIEDFTTSSALEVQKRACEYFRLINNEWEGDRAAICETIPISKFAAENFKDKPIGDTDLDEFPPQN